MPVKRVSKSLKVVKEEPKIVKEDEPKKLESLEHHKLEDLDVNVKEVVLKRLNGVLHL
jgi:hypothetical protein